MTPAVCLRVSCVFHSVRVYLVLFPLQMGQVNPSVRLYVVTVDGSSITTELMPPNSFEKRFVQTEQTHSNSQSLRDCLFGWLNLHLVVVFLFFCSDFYVTMVKWATPERLNVRWVNRAQNMSILSLCDVTTSACEKVRGLSLTVRLA